VEKMLISFGCKKEITGTHTEINKSHHQICAACAVLAILETSPPPPTPLKKNKKKKINK
jgi:hypothetical protein